MTSVFPDISSKQMIKVLERLGFAFIRQSGTSHAIYRRAKDNKRTVVPIHGHKSLKRRTIKSICKDLGINLEDLKAML